MTGADVIQFMMQKPRHQKALTRTQGTITHNSSQNLQGYATGVYQPLGDKKLSSASKPNSAPYNKGAKYTGKEHVWDEALVIGSRCHTLTLTSKKATRLQKEEPRSTDYSKDGVVDAGTEMTYAHAYYASGFDKGGKRIIWKL